MAFWDIFSKFSTSNKKNDQNNDTQKGKLYQKIKDLLPDSSEEELIKIACISGLLARVAYVDFKIDKNEVVLMQKVLKDWTTLSEQDIDVTVNLSLEAIQELAGLENHKYCGPLNDILSQEQRYELLEALFALAAGDNTVENIESEEIRLIAQGLRLSHQHYISARATVINKLKALS